MGLSGNLRCGKRSLLVWTGGEIYGIERLRGKRSRDLLSTTYQLTIVHTVLLLCTMSFLMSLVS